MGVLVFRGGSSRDQAGPGADPDVPATGPNAFRHSYAHRLDVMSRFIERLKIPVVMLGVGAQTDVDGDREYLRPIDEAVTRFCRAVLGTTGSR